jgi:hypothetical protein
MSSGKRKRRRPLGARPSSLSKSTGTDMELRATNQVPIDP